MYAIGLLLIPFVFYRLGMRKSLLVTGLSVLSLVLLLLGFLVATFMTFIFTDQVRTWHLPEAWVNSIHIDSANFYMIFAIPLIFVADLVRWVLYLNIFHGNILMWLVMAAVAYKIIQIWVVGIQTFNQNK